MIRYIEVTNDSCKICVCMEEDFEDILCEKLEHPTCSYVQEPKICLIENDIAIDDGLDLNMCIFNLFNQKLFGPVIISKRNRFGEFCSLSEDEAFTLKNKIMLEENKVER